MESLLPNMRWVCLSSDGTGEDWFVKSQAIDSILAQESLDLSEEVVYIHFHNSQCFIARPVIGPKKVMNAPFTMVDWTAQTVWAAELEQTGDLESILREAKVHRTQAEESLKKLSNAFLISVRRKLNPDLHLSVQAIFYR